MQCALKWVEVATKRKSAKQALKGTVAKTAHKQFGGSLHSGITRGRQVIKRRRQQYAKPRTYNKSSTKKSFLENHSQEGVDWIFSLESEMRTNIIIPSEATHSSLDFFEKPPLLVTFDQSIEQKNWTTFFSLWIIARIRSCRRSQQFQRFAENLFGSKMSNTKC